MNTTLELTGDIIAAIEIKWHQSGQGYWLFTFSADYNDNQADFYAKTYNEALIQQIQGCIFDGEREEALELVLDQIIPATSKVYDEIEQWCIGINQQEIDAADQDAADMEATHNSLNSQFSVRWNA